MKSVNFTLAFPAYRLYFGTYTNILIFILCLMSCSCERKQMKKIGENQHLYVIDIDKAEEVEEILLSEICSQMKTIILETNDNILIGQEGGIQVYKDYIFVLDKRFICFQ